MSSNFKTIQASYILQTTSPTPSTLLFKPYYHILHFHLFSSMHSHSTYPLTQRTKTQLDPSTTRTPEP
jgi:hypothetical protein